MLLLYVSSCEGSMTEAVLSLAQGHNIVPLTKLLTSFTLMETRNPSLSIFNTVNSATKGRLTFFLVQQAYKTANHRPTSETPFKRHFASGPIVAQDCLLAVGLKEFTK